MTIKSKRLTGAILNQTVSILIFSRRRTIFIPILTFTKLKKKELPFSIWNIFYHSGSVSQYMYLRILRVCVCGGGCFHITMIRSLRKSTYRKKDLFWLIVLGPELRYILLKQSPRDPLLPLRLYPPHFQSRNHNLNPCKEELEA